MQARALPISALVRPNYPRTIITARITILLPQTQKNRMKFSRLTMPESGALQTVSFYSHAVDGPKVRLGLYREDSPSCTVPALAVSLESANTG